MTTIQLLHQAIAGDALLERYRDYARSIGCTTYEDGLLCDSIEVHTDEQSEALHKWWQANA